MTAVVSAITGRAVQTLHIDFAVVFAYMRVCARVCVCVLWVGGGGVLDISQTQFLMTAFITQLFYAATSVKILIMYACRSSTKKELT